MKFYRSPLESGGFEYARDHGDCREDEPGLDESAKHVCLLRVNSP